MAIRNLLITAFSYKARLFNGGEDEFMVDPSIEPEDLERYFDIIRAAHNDACLRYEKVPDDVKREFPNIFKQ